MKSADLLDALVVARDCGLEIPDRAQRLAELLGLDADGLLVLTEALTVQDESTYEATMEFRS